jgi:hypothetical protein
MNQTRPHCVNQMGKTHSKPVAARHGRATAWARHAMCESASRRSTNITNTTLYAQRIDPYLISYLFMGLRYPLPRSQKFASTLYLSQINPVLTLTPYFFQTLSNSPLILPWFFPVLSSLSILPPPHFLPFRPKYLPQHSLLSNALSPCLSLM